MTSKEQNQELKLTFRRLSKSAFRRPRNQVIQPPDAMCDTSVSAMILDVFVALLREPSGVTGSARGPIGRLRDGEELISYNDKELLREFEDC